MIIQDGIAEELKIAVGVQAAKEVIKFFGYREKFPVAVGQQVLVGIERGAALQFDQLGEGLAVFVFTNAKVQHQKQRFCAFVGDIILRRDRHRRCLAKTRLHQHINDLPGGGNQLLLQVAGHKKGRFRNAKLDRVVVAGIEVLVKSAEFLRGKCRIVSLTDRRDHESSVWKRREIHLNIGGIIARCKTPCRLSCCRISVYLKNREVPALTPNSRRMESRIVETLLARQQSGWSLEQPFYTHPEIFDLEWEHIWKKYWLFAGSSAEIPNPGDYITYQAYKDSIILIRGDQGEVFAHFNTCRHRGSVICTAEKGHAPKLLCPYHNWVYNRDGSLFRARLMPEDFDRSAYGLHPVHVREVNGLIFISLAQDPPDFSQVHRDFSPFVSPFKIGEAKVAAQKRYELRTNWKLVAENFRECYHCGVAHPEYCSAVIGANLREDTAEVLAEKRKVWQSKGLATETVEFQPDSFHFAVRYPLRPGVQSYSLDGGPVARPMGAHSDFDAGVLGLVLLPNFWMDAVSDYVWTMRVTPAGPSKTYVDLSWLVDKNAVEGVDYTVERLTDFWRVTGEQDWELCENNFKGIESSRYQPGPYAPVEVDVAKFVDWYLDRMKEGIWEKAAI
ncbi:MAG: aromatic ring-hydroxylating dioxygenase subunit alpha [Bacteroidetes bacterium]|nr:MAG: aromatic ring-hydroxylating dioxygenase subunit alpha [Bacteroidota bacterium]